MAYIWFNLVLTALGKRLNYESLSNLYGNAFAKEAAKIIQAANPLLKNAGKQSGGIMSLTGKIKIVDAGQSKEAGLKIAEQQLGDLSWATDLFGKGNKGETPAFPF